MGKRTNTAQWMEKQKRWQINVQKDGIRRSFTSAKPGRTGQREANAKADAWLDEGISGGLRVDYLFGLYLEKLKDTTSTSNYKQAAFFWERYIKSNIGRLKIDKLTENHLQQVIDRAWAERKADGSRVSKKTLSGLRTCLSSFLKFCRKQKATTLFPEDLTIPSGAVVKEKNILQPEDLRALFSCDQTLWRGKPVFDDLIFAYRFQVITGLRPGELLGLEWSDLSDDYISIRRAINSLGETTHGKNDNARRTVVLTDLGLSLLDAQRRLSTTRRIFGDINQQYYYKRWKTFCSYNSITSTTPYELRHTFVSIAKTLPEGEVKSIVGHSRNMDTFGIYGHEVNGERKETARKLSLVMDRVLHPD